MKTAFRRTLLCAALALAASPVFAQSQSDTPESPFSQTVFFGDSLTDGGFYRPFLIETQGPSAAVVGQFTTNPGYVWAQILADYYGSNAAPAWGLTTGGVVAADGNNYAAGGATFNTGPGFPPTPPTMYAPTIPTQVAAYLASTGGHADAAALYTVWGGANDLFFHLNAVTNQAQFLAAAGVEVSVVQGLSQAGAQYIMVPNLPDVGRTPFGLSQGPAGSAGITALVEAYNAALYGGLATANLHVIPLDTFHFIRELSDDPATYGFTNVTGTACVGVPSSLVCSPLSTVPGGADTYAFADSVHPTAAAHRMLADYAISVLEGPRQIAVLPHSAATVGLQRSREVASSITDLSNQGDGTRWWGSLRGDQQRFNNSVGFDGNGGTGSLGFGWRDGNLMYGAFGGWGTQSIDFGYSRGKFRQSDKTLGGFIGWGGDSGLWANAQVSYSWLDFRVHRDVTLGNAVRTHSGSPEGENLSYGGGIGWNFRHGAWQNGPVLTVLAQDIKVDGYAEDSTLSTALTYPNQRFHSLIGSLGWQASYAINDHLVPYAKLTWDREFKDQPAQVWAQSNSLPGSLPYAVPGLTYDQSYGTLMFGVRSKVMGLDLTTGSSLTFNQRGGGDSSFFVTVGGSF